MLNLPPPRPIKTEIDKSTEIALLSMQRTFETCMDMLQLCRKDINSHVNEVTDPDVNVILRRSVACMEGWQRDLSSCITSLDKRKW